MLTLLIKDNIVTFIIKFIFLLDVEDKNIKN